MQHPLFTVTILYDNRSMRDDLLSSHGFSCLIENHQGRRVLFDTGESGPLLLALNSHPIAGQEMGYLSRRKRFFESLSNLYPE